jgi:hypothetical protein
MTELPQPHEVEIARRSVAMLPPGAPALTKEKALALYEQLLDALDAAGHPSSG